MTVIKVQRLKWLAHVYRMPDERFPKKPISGKPGGGRNKGTPHARWIDGAEDDLRRIGVKI